MIFVTVIAVGALVGLVVQAGPRAVSAPSRIHRGAAGAFLAGALLVGLSERQVGPADPLALAAAVAGALTFMFLLGRLEQRPLRASRGRLPRSRGCPG